MNFPVFVVILHAGNRDDRSPLILLRFSVISCQRLLKITQILFSAIRDSSPEQNFHGDS